MERRGNLEGLFADRVVLIEGRHDEGFYETLRCIFKLEMAKDKFTLFVKAGGGGKEELRQARKFYMQMGFDDVSIVCDLDYLFSTNVKHILKDIGLDDKCMQSFRTHIGWTDERDPSLKIILAAIRDKGEPKDLDKVVSDLSQKRIFVIRKGSPEQYYKNAVGEKDGWESLRNEGDLLDAKYLKQLMVDVLS